MLLKNRKNWGCSCTLGCALDPRDPCLVGTLTATTAMGALPTHHNRGISPPMRAEGVTERSPGGVMERAVFTADGLLVLLPGVRDLRPESAFRLGRSTGGGCRGAPAPFRPHGRHGNRVPRRAGFGLVTNCAATVHAEVSG